MHKLSKNKEQLNKPKELYKKKLLCISYNILSLLIKNAHKNTDIKFDKNVF